MNVEWSAAIEFKLSSRIVMFLLLLTEISPVRQRQRSSRRQRQNNSRHRMLIGSNSERSVVVVASLYDKKMKEGMQRGRGATICYRLLISSWDGGGKGDASVEFI